MMMMTGARMAARREKAMRKVNKTFKKLDFRKVGCQPCHRLCFGADAVSIQVSLSCPLAPYSKRASKWPKLTRRHQRMERRT